MWITLVAFVALVTDLKFRKIYNWLTLPAMLIGLVLSFFTAGFSGVLYGLLGMVISLVTFGWMWGIGILGAGDVKLLMAFAALSGAAAAAGRSGVMFSVDLSLLSLFVGGALAFLLLAFKGRLKPFFSKFYRFLLTFMNRHLETEFPKADPTLKMPFGISIAIAAVWLWFDNPLTRWGIHSWN